MRAQYACRTLLSEIGVSLKEGEILTVTIGSSVCSILKAMIRLRFNQGADVCGIAMSTSLTVSTSAA